MAEWSNAAVLKTVDLNGSGGSNPSLSAEKGVTDICSAFFDFRIPKNIPKVSQGVLFWISRKSMCLSIDLCKSEQKVFNI